MVKLDILKLEIYQLLVIDGEIDASCSIELDDKINQMSKENSHVLIDCERLEYISSAGLGVFMSHKRVFDDNSKRMILFGIQEKVLNIFTILGLDQLLDITSDRSEAEIKLNEI